MSSTNHTTNYNLPQFVGSDKPAWLGDINPAFSAIDTAMHANAVSATTAGTDATTANNNIGTMANLTTTEKTTLVGAINEVNSTAGTAQTTANTAIGNAQTVATALETFMRKFNFTTFTDGDTSQMNPVGVVINNLTLAQNSDGSIFKVYGNLQVNPSASVAKKAIAGMSGYYGVDLNLQLASAPTEAYIIKAGGVVIGTRNDAIATYGSIGTDLAVGTDGRVYMFPNTSSGNVSFDNTSAVRCWAFPCVYFNISFGDTPTPDA